MRRIAPLLLIAACSGREAAEIEQPEVPQVAAPSPPPPTARHASAIEVLAVTDDARAAVSQDRGGSTRLWPTLDGTREPVIVQLAMAIELAIARHADGYVMAALDQAGGIEILAVDRDGRTRTRTRIAPEPAIERLAMQGDHVLALRADQTISVIAPDGSQRARLQPPPGTRIIELYTRGGHALALVETGTERRGMRITGAAWGATTPWIALLPEDKLHGAALSPDGAFLAVPRANEVVVFDLATGGTSRTIEATDIESAGYVTASDFALVTTSRELRWSSTAGLSEPVGMPGALASIVDGMMINASGDRLELRTPTGARTLGYRLDGDLAVSVASNGAVLTGNASDAIEIDAELRETRRTSLPGQGARLVDAKWVTSDRVLVAHRLHANSIAISLVDMPTQTTIQTLTALSTSRRVRYQLGTDLVAVSDSIASYLVRFDDTTAKFETWYRVQSEPADLYVLDPAQSEGIIAVAVRGSVASSSRQVERIRAHELVVGSPIAAADTFTFTGDFAAIDHRGRIYIADGSDLVVHDGAQELLRIPGALTAVGSHVQRRLHIAAQDDDIAVLEEPRLSLYKTGTLRWQTTHPLAQDIAWMGDRLVGQFHGGALATFDTNTGDLAARTCGWGFGLVDGVISSPSNTDVESICDAP